MSCIGHGPFYGMSLVDLGVTVIAVAPPGQIGPLPSPVEVSSL